MTRAIASNNRATAPLLAAMAAVVIGVAVVRSPLLAVLLLAVLGIVVATIRFGVFALCAASLALLPWMVTFEGVLPNELGTLAAAGGAVTLIALVWPLKFDSPLIPTAAFFLVAITLGHAAFATDREQFVQAAKYMTFCGVAIATTSVNASGLMPRLKRPVYGSAIGAMTVHICVIAAGLGSTDSYYGAGEKLGFAASGPHALALLSMIIAVTGLMAPTSWQKAGGFALGAVPAALTGVRSALLGLVVGLAAFVVKSEAKLRALSVLALIAVVAYATGALDVVLTRFSEHAGEFNSFSSAGSGRGEIWTTAFDAWEKAGPWAWGLGTGLRTIPHFELLALGEELVGHSDIVEVLVQFGVIGFASWLAIWVGLLRSRSATLILLPIVTFGAVNGSLEYVASLTTGLVLAAIFAAPRIEGRSG